MTTPNKIRTSALTLNAMMEAFEHCYMSVIEIGEAEPTLRQKGCYAFYGLRDMLDILVDEMEQLAGHMDVCDVVLATRIARGEVNMEVTRK